MKKLMLLILAVIISLTLGGIGALSHATQWDTPAPQQTQTQPRQPQSPAMLDSKPELATPQPKPPMDLTAPGASGEKVAPKEDKTKSTP